MMRNWIYWHTPWRADQRFFFEWYPEETTAEGW